MGTITIQPARQPMSLLLRFLSGVIFVIAVTLFIFVLIMQPPLAAFRDMTLFLSATAVLSLLAGYVAYKVGWINRSRRLRWTLLGSSKLRQRILMGMLRGDDCGEMREGNRVSRFESARPGRLRPGREPPLQLTR